MCGIFGFYDKSGKVTPHQRQLLAALNSSRGEEGTGFVYKHHKKGMRMWKTKESIIDFLASRQGPRDLWESPILLGHCRRASRANCVGGQADKNAHPFQSGSIIGAHNGYMANWIEEGNKVFKSMQGIDVDSQVIMQLINKHGPKEGLAKVRGVASVWWIDRNEKDAFYLWQWMQDLVICEGDGFFAFSSEEKHMRAAGIKGDFSQLKRDLGQMFKVEDGICNRLEDVKGKSEPVFVDRRDLLDRRFGIGGVHVDVADEEERRHNAIMRSIARRDSEAHATQPMNQEEVENLIQFVNVDDLFDIMSDLGHRKANYYCSNCGLVVTDDECVQSWQPAAKETIRRHKSCSRQCKEITYFRRRQIMKHLYLQLSDKQKDDICQDLKEAISVETKQLLEDVSTLQQRLADIEQTEIDNIAKQIAKGTDEEIDPNDIVGNVP